MEPPLNRTAIIVNLAAFFCVSVFCISTDAPMIQQDILKKCQDILLIHRMSISGLSVDGRDVLLSGEAESPILSPQIRVALERVNGVRVVRTRVLAGNASRPRASQALPEEIQRNIDRVLENQGISFKTDTTTLTPQSEEALNKIAASLLEAPDLLCEIRGYENQAGSARQNWVLALQRALAAETYLENKGVANWRLSTRAFHTGEPGQGVQNHRLANLPLDFLVRVPKQGPEIRE
jgi:hypothetical protein